MSSYQSMVLSYWRLPFAIFLCSSFDLESGFALLLSDKNLFHLRGDVSVNLALLHDEISGYLSFHIDRLLPDFHAGGKTVAVLHKNSRHLSEAGHLYLPLLSQLHDVLPGMNLELLFVEILP